MGKGQDGAHAVGCDDLGPLHSSINRPSSSPCLPIRSKCETSLHDAYVRGDTPAAIALIEKGANVNEKDEDGCIPPTRIIVIKKLLLLLLLKSYMNITP